MSAEYSREHGPGPAGILVAYPETESFRPGPEAAATFLAYCETRKRPGELADRADFLAEHLRPWFGHIMILDHLPDLDDFRYRMYGTGIARESGFDMTGKLVSDFRSGTGEFFLGLYREAVAKRCIICSVNSAVHGQYSCDWHRVLCPVRKGGGVQILACNYPVFERAP